MDSETGRLLDGLESEGLLDDTLVVVTADHGESLGEHGYFFDHGLNLFQPSVHVPLLMAFPGVLEPGSQVDELVETVDIMPTILELLGLGGVEDQQGDVIPLPGRARTVERSGVLQATAFSQTVEHSPGTPPTARFAVRQGRWKYISVPGTHQQELYDLGTDPGETINLVTDDRTRADSLATLMEDWLVRTEPFVAEKLDNPDILEQLKALGYLH